MSTDGTPDTPANTPTAPGRRRPLFTPNLVVGIGITLAGVVLTLDRLGSVSALDALRFWPVLLILFGAAVATQAVRGGEGGPYGRGQRPIVTAPLVLLIVVVGVLATRTGVWDGIVARVNDRDAVTVNALMGANRYAITAPFHGAKMTSVMGESRLDLRDATMAPGEDAVIDVFALMGGVVIHVPEGWVVDVQTMPVMGGIKDQRPRDARTRAAGRADAGGSDSATPARTDAVAGTPTDARAAATALEADQLVSAPRVVIRGFIMMGALTLRS